MEENLGLSFLPSRYWVRTGFMFYEYVISGIALSQSTNTSKIGGKTIDSVALGSNVRMWQHLGWCFTRNVSIPRLICVLIPCKCCDHTHLTSVSSMSALLSVALQSFALQPTCTLSAQPNPRVCTNVHMAQM